MTSPSLLEYIAALAVATSAGVAFRHYTKPSLDRVATPENRIIPDIIHAMEEVLQEPDIPTRNRELRHLLTGLSGHEIHAALVRLGAQKNDWALRNIELELLVQWTAMDPRSALGWIKKLDESSRHNATLLVASAWLQKNETEALAWAEDPSGGPEASSIRTAMLTVMASRDPKKTIALLQARPKLAKPNGWWIVFSTIAARDLQTAMAEANLLPEGRTRSGALSAIASFLAGRDPVAAETWIKTLPSGPMKKSAMEDLAMTLSLRNPKEAIRIIMAERAAGYDRIQRIGRAAWFWAGKDPTAFKEWLEQLPDDDLRRDMTSTLVTRWAEKDPRAAIDYALSTPDAPARVTVASAALVEWLQNDFKSGRTWLESESNALQPTLLLKTVEELSWYSPANAALLMEGLPDGDQRNEIYRNLADGWTQRDPWAAAAWLDKMPEGTGKDEFTKGYFRAIASADISLAMQKFATLPESSVRNSAATDIATTWGKTDPSAALNWITANASIEAQNGAVKEVMNNWAQADNEAASGWLKTLPAGTLKDTAIQRYSTTTSASDPAKAALWAMAIDEPDKRLDTVRRVVRRWLRQDAPAAKAWVDSATIPKEWKSRLLP